VRARFLAVAAFVSVWLIASILPGLRASAVDLRAIGTALSLPGSAIGSIFLTLVWVALAVFPLLFIGLVIRLLLRRQWRRKEEEAREPVSTDSPFTLREAILPVLLLISILAAGRIVWVHLSTAEERPSSAVPAPPVSDVRPSRPETTLNAGPRRTEIPSWVLLGAAGALLTGTAWLLWRNARSRNGGEPGGTESVEPPTFLAVETITAGAAVSEPVFACYRDMCILLSDRLPIRDSMTPREFARQLRQGGFASRDVDVLTGLFERVRYGHQTAGPGNREQARSALETIRGQLQGDKRE